MTRRYAFLLTRRWLGVAALTVTVAVVCTILGSWQLGRHEYRAETIARVEQNTSQAAVPLTTLVTSATEPLPEDMEWRSVVVTGRYVGEPVMLPQRGVENAAADHALAVLAVDAPDGGTCLVVVDRGWYPTDAFADPTPRLQTPTGEVRLELRLRPAEPASTRDPVVGQVFRIAPSQVVAAAGVADGGTIVEGAYGWLVSETPTTADPPTALPIPAANYRSNLSYALQWWTFGVLAFVGFAVLARRERAAMDRASGVAEPRHEPRRSRRLSDADAEDAELDAAETRLGG